MPPLVTGYSRNYSHSLHHVDEKIHSLLSLYSSEAAKGAVYQMSSGGKRIRAYLSLSCSQLLGLDYEYAVTCAAISELLHNASLVHDDIQDRSDTRRDLLSIWKKYGSDIAICSGDLLISAAFAAVAMAPSRHSFQIIKHLHSCISETICGQSADLSTRYNKRVTQGDYLEIVSQKTAPLLSLPIELAFIYAGESKFLSSIRSCIAAYSIAYQVYDDIKDADIDGNEGNLNIVNIYSRELSSVSALEQAARLAEESLVKFNILTEHIPFGCGNILKQLPGNTESTKFSSVVKISETRKGEYKTIFPYTDVVTRSNHV